MSKIEVTDKRLENQLEISGSHTLQFRLRHSRPRCQDTHLDRSGRGGVRGRGGGVRSGGGGVRSGGGVVGGGELEKEIGRRC